MFFLYLVAPRLGQKKFHRGSPVGVVAECALSLLNEVDF